MTRSVRVLVILGVLGATSRAAASPTARLVYVRGEGAGSCPDETTLKQWVADRLGYDPFRPFAATTLFADVHRERNTLVGSVKLVDESGMERGARKIDASSEDCRELMTSMALSMSIAIDPASAFTTPKPPPPERVAPPLLTDEPPEPPRVEPPVVDAPRRPPPPRGAIGLGAHGALGAAPAPTLGASLSAEIAWPDRTTGVELRIDAPGSADLAGGGSVRTWLVGGALVACSRVTGVVLCGVGLGGRVAAETVDVPTPTARAFVFVAAGLRLTKDFSLGDGAVLRPAVEVLGTITPFVLEVDGQHVFRSPVGAARLGASIVKFF